MNAIEFRRDNKFDLQLSQALIHERRLGEIFSSQTIEKIELKSETFQWEQTGNICIEYRCDGKPSGIAVTEADFWVHEAIRLGRCRSGAGDGKRFDVALLRLSDILK